MDLKKNPRVSVIIPTYNRKAFLSEAIDSVLAQTFRDFEVIVVDDGSTDGTGEFLRGTYGKRIRYFYRENGGCAAARNYGVAAARGEYIAFLDSDDRYLPNKLEDQVAFLERHPSCGFVGADIIVEEAGKSYRFRTVRPDRDGRITYPLFIFTFYSLCAATFRRSCFEQAGSFDEGLRYNEDTDFLLRAAINFRAGFSQRPTLRYRVHEGGKSTDQVKLLQAVYASSLKAVTQNPGFAPGKKSVDKRLGQIKLDLALAYTVRNNPREGAQELALSRELYPSLKKTLYAFLFERELITRSPVRSIALFAERLQKAATWYLYKWGGRI